MPTPPSRWRGHPTAPGQHDWNAKISSARCLNRGSPVAWCRSTAKANGRPTANQRCPVCPASTRDRGFGREGHLQPAGLVQGGEEAPHRHCISTIRSRQSPPGPHAPSVRSPAARHRTSRSTWNPSGASRLPASCLSRSRRGRDPVGSPDSGPRARRSRSRSSLGGQDRVGAGVETSDVGVQERRTAQNRPPP